MMNWETRNLSVAEGPALTAKLGVQHESGTTLYWGSSRYSRPGVRQERRQAGVPAKCSYNWGSSKAVAVQQGRGSSGETAERGMSSRKQQGRMSRKAKRSEAKAQLDVQWRWQRRPRRDETTAVQQYSTAQLQLDPPRGFRQPDSHGRSAAAVRLAGQQQQEFGFASTATATEGASCTATARSVVGQQCRSRVPGQSSNSRESSVSRGEHVEEDRGSRRENTGEYERRQENTGE